VNDEEEILGFYDRILPRILRPVFQKYIEEIKNFPELKKQQGSMQFELFCDEQFATFMSILKNIAPKLHDHYITSFSTTTEATEPWVSEHGLLSQWRAYGSDGGYALVFDTGPLDKILSEETTPYQEEIFSWVDVQYHLNENRRTVDPDTNQLIERLETAADKYFRSRTEDDASELSEPLTILSCLFKHRGFEEEREVRLVLSLLGSEPESHPEFLSVLQHPVQTMVRRGEAVPFVELCVRAVGGVRQHLPIKRIIVGPHREKNDRKRAVQLLLKQHGLTANVIVSDIPYRG
jgi:hypothetical protein